ncbi:MAG: hypothetical protein M3Z56_05155 [Bacteroidota bacterium]|nr:hypothetical protein [Bacteroidota bacterium]
MKQQPEQPEDEKFSDNPEENLRLENDFLKMKMMAESGALFGGEGDLPADIENQFLKNIIEFEQANSNSNPQKIYELIGKPEFADEENLSESEFIMEFERLQNLLKNNSIHVDFIKERDDRFKYKFITTELFDHESIFIPVQEMTVNFIYEEFHPDHEQEIKDTTDRFFNDFFNRELSIDTAYLNNEHILPDGKVISKQQVINKFQSMYEAVPGFENTSFIIDDAQFELKENESRISGMGFSEGTVTYDLLFEDGDRKKVHGPFKIYFSREWERWGICFFYLAGFNMHKGSQ